MRVYIKPGCPWCVDAVAWLRREGYPFEEIDVISDPEAFAEMRRLSGQSCAPTMTVEVDGQEKLLADFGVDELVSFLDEHGITPPTR